MPSPQKNTKNSANRKNKLRIRHRESPYWHLIGRTNNPINEEPNIGKSRRRYQLTRKRKQSTSLTKIYDTL